MDVMGLMMQSLGVKANDMENIGRVMVELSALPREVKLLSDVIELQRDEINMLRQELRDARLDIKNANDILKQLL